jgi:ABC-type lipoprotein release transport system permease subunit
MLIFKIAWRNIKRHKGKSLVVAFIILLGAFIMTAGNATIIGMERGLEENFVKRMTGHIILVSNDEEKTNVLFTPMAKPIKLLKEFDKIKAALQKQDYIEDFLPMTRGGAIVLESSTMYPILVFGVNFKDYQKMFSNNLYATEGKLLENGDHGILINAKGRDNMFKMLGYWTVPEGANVVDASLTAEAKAERETLEVRRETSLMGFGNENASDIRLPVKGIYKAQSLNAFWDGIAVIDIESFRECFGYFTARDLIVDLPPAQKKLMDAGESDFFGGDDIFSSGDTSLNIANVEKNLKPATTTVKKIDYDTSAYNFFSIKLKPGVSVQDGLNRLNKIIADEKLPAKVLGWRDAVGQIAQFASILSTIIAVFVVLLFFVAAVIIMNTLSMTAMERTEELGMMRAVGARKSFIGKMFLMETFILAFFGGGLGIFLAVIATWIVRPLGITSNNSDLLDLFFGGDTFQPTLGFIGLVQSIGILALVILVSILYPIIVARRITPLDAINRH